MSNVSVLDIVAKSEINLLIQLAQVDKHFAPVEREMIYRIGREKNFPEDKVELLMQNPEPIGTLGALSANQKLNYLLDCIELIFIDDKVFECELNFCRGIAMKMGLKKNVIDFLVENRQILSREELKTRVFGEFAF
jgi:hypothetical protein